MAKKERVREELTQPLTREYLEERAQEGFRAVSVVWEREVADDGGPTRVKSEVPYGLRISDDCHSLETDPREQDVLTTILGLIVDDHPLSQVAEELNRRGFETRGGRPWTQVAIFNLLPRLTEAAPEIFATEGWSELRRQRFLRAVG